MSIQHPPPPAPCQGSEKLPNWPRTHGGEGPSLPPRAQDQPLAANLYPLLPTRPVHPHPTHPRTGVTSFSGHAELGDGPKHFENVGTQKFGIQGCVPGHPESGRCRPEPGPPSKTFLHPGPFCIPSYGHQSLFGPQACPPQGRWGRVGSGCPARLVTTSCTPLALSSWQNTVAATPGLNFTAQNS